MLFSYTVLGLENGLCKIYTRKWKEMVRRNSIDRDKTKLVEPRKRSYMRWSLLLLLFETFQVNPLTNYQIGAKTYVNSLHNVLNDRPNRVLRSGPLLISYTLGFRSHFNSSSSSGNSLDYIYMLLSNTGNLLGISLTYGWSWVNTIER